jgi:DNA topoisomerase-1
VTKPLIIVESPAKARTIAGYLGADFDVTSSVGHIRDLPRNAKEVPEKLKGEAWARLGVNVDAGFEPLYVVTKEKKDTVKQLRKLVKEASELYLATDEDREGESIAWHLLEVLKPKVPVRRMVFHEITPDAIRAALESPRSVDQQLVDAQEARRILDRLYGYEVSPVLWKKVRQGLSAGRVQSVATRVVVERERERMAFRSASYWGIDASLLPHVGEGTFDAPAVTIDGKRIATGKDFDELGRQKRDEVIILDQPTATDFAAALQGAKATVTSVERKPYRRSPYPPFRTSTLQQEAGRKLRFSAQRTMSVAQRLYEGGYITYMRTDSITLSDTAMTAARAQITDLYGPKFLSEKPRTYSKKVRNAQEAHEAIRPAGDRFRTPMEVVGELENDQARLYELIWKRTVASQMTDAIGETLQVRLEAPAGDRTVGFTTSGRTITFPGFLRAYVEGSDDPDAELDDQERRLPALAEGDHAEIVSAEAGGHETKPPARYTEASLVRKLEELSVGRPSTYASIISTIQDRGYVWKRGTALVPTFTAFATVTLLETHFPNLVDYAFTARMEDDLDRISNGDEESTPWLSGFYFGNGQPGLRDMVSSQLAEIDARAVNSIPVGSDEAGVEIIARVGRYGPYLERGEDRASIPEDLAPDELTAEKAIELLAMPSGDQVLGTDPDSGLPVIAKAGRFGPYVQLGEPEEGSKEKPKTASLFKSMSLDDLTLEQALKLLTLPRLLGDDPADGEPIEALNGRYGPYVRKGKESRSIETEEQLFTVTLDEALKLLAEPKRRRGQRAAAPPLKEFGEDPSSGKPVVLKSGRYGPYVTDGDTNASLRKGDDQETLTEERAFELLADRRAKLGK